MALRGFVATVPFLIVAMVWLIAEPPRGGSGSGGTRLAAAQDDDTSGKKQMSKDGSHNVLREARMMELPTQAEVFPADKGTAPSAPPNCADFDACVLKGDRLGPCCQNHLAFENRTCAICLQAACWKRTMFCRFAGDEGAEAPDEYCPFCYRLGGMAQGASGKGNMPPNKPGKKWGEGKPGGKKMQEAMAAKKAEKMKWKAEKEEAARRMAEK